MMAGGSAGQIRTDPELGNIESSAFAVKATNELQTPDGDNVFGIPGMINCFANSTGQTAPIADKTPGVLMPPGVFLAMGLFLRTSGPSLQPCGLPH